MNTLETLKKLRTAALLKKQTLKSLRAEFIALCEADKELAALEFNREWCSVGGNSVEQAKKTKGFDMFAVHVNKIINILESVDIDWFSDDEPEQEEKKPVQSQADRELELIRALPENEAEKLSQEFEAAEKKIFDLIYSDMTKEQEAALNLALENVKATNKKKGYEMDSIEKLKQISQALEPSKPYFTLVIKECGKWEIAFGDYDYKTVTDEIEDSYSEYATRILRTDTDKQADIEKAVKELNGD